MRYRIDAGATTWLAICECGQRFLAMDRPAALTRLALHEQVWHPADKNVRSRLAPSARHAGPRKR